MTERPEQSGDLVAPFRRQGRLQGHCTCGAVTVTVDGDYVAAVGACHCLMCQRWSGGVFLSFEAAADAVTAEGPVVRSATSDFAERAFCGTCGGHLWMQDMGENEAFNLMPGLFLAAAAFSLISEIYTDRAPKYVPLHGTHARRTGAEYEISHPHVEGDT